jgi:hypothetical protein
LQKTIEQSDYVFYLYIYSNQNLNNMDQLKSILCAILIGSVIFGCENDESDNYCDEPGGIEVTDKNGKIYKRRDFYYIGGVNEVPDGVNGGWIPCTGMPEAFQKEGMLVIYSGIKKEGPSDHQDPLFGLIVLTEIKENTD